MSPPAKKTATKTKPAKSPGPYARRDDLGEKADAYFAAIPEPFRAIAARVRKIVRGAAPDASEEIKWGMPVYSQDGLLCYVRFRGGYVTLGFYESGRGLDDPDGLLEGTGENMRHVKIRGPKDVRPDLFARWVLEAAEHNRLAKG